MQAALDKMCVCEDDQSIVFQVEGKGTMKQAPALRERAERALADGVRRLHVDLRRCHYMDSTFLGTLLLLMRAIRQLEHGEFALVSPSAECRQLLEKMRLDTVYSIVDLGELPAYLWTDLPAELGRFGLLRSGCGPGPSRTGRHPRSARRHVFRLGRAADARMEGEASPH
jgi:anti-anti-sigma factor